MSMTPEISTVRYPVALAGWPSTRSDTPAAGRPPCPTPPSRGTAARRPGFDHDAYRHRHTLERCVDKPKQRCGPATRYDKAAIAHLSTILIRSAR